MGSSIVRAHEVAFREAAVWSVVWVTLALTFSVLLYQYSLYAFERDPRLAAIPGFDSQVTAWQVTLEFLTGYIVEKSLSVDNIFVFVVVFNYFGILPKYQHRVLFYGILGALVLRGIFIAMGSVLMQYHAIVFIFGGFLIFTGFKLVFSHPEKVEPDKNLLLRLFQRWVPITTKISGQRFLMREHGRLYATPFFATLLVVELTDVIFAVDSVPAIFALTREPLIVFTSNIFAILGLRAMYFMLAGAVTKFHLLKYGLAIVLVFIGLKMMWLNNLFDGKSPIVLSLGIICTVIVTSIVLSLIFPVGKVARNKRKHPVKVGKHEWTAPKY